MKTSSFKPFASLVLMVFVFARVVSATAVTLSISPSIISNHFAGVISIQIGSGLTNGESVVLETFADFNANGAVDANELLVQSFIVADGQTSVIGGVTNINVPADLNPTGAAITTEMNYAQANFRPFAGAYVCRASSPASRFTPVTAILNVTNSNFSQTLSGVVRHDATNVPHAYIVILDALNEDNDLVAGTFSDTTGNYAVKVPPGIYQVLAAKKGYVNNLMTAPQLTVGTNATINTNLFLTAATVTISGKIFDAENTNKNIPGIFIIAQSEDDKLTLAFSDTNGHLEIPVTPGIWHLHSGENVASLAYMSPEEDFIPAADTTGGNIANFNLALPPVEGLIHGYLRDAATNPIPGIRIEAYDDEFYSQTVSDSNGYFVLGVASGNWQASASGDDLSNLGYGSANGTNVNVSAGQAVPVNFIVQTPTAHLIGRATDSGGNPLSFVRIFANGSMGGNFSGLTDGNGNFVVGVTAGTWYLQISTEDTENLGLVSPNPAYTVGNGTNITGINLVAQNITAQITGYVRDNNSNAIPFIDVFANAFINGTNYAVNTETDGNGNYSLGVLNGAWSAGVSGDDLYARGFDTPANQNVAVAGGNGTANFTVHPFQPLHITTTNLPSGLVGQSYTAILNAAGGRQPYSWSYSGSFPPGLILESWGGINGTPSTDGTFHFTAHVNDFAGNSTNQNFSLTISPSLPPAFLSYGWNTNGHFELLIQGMAGRSYRLDGSTTLIPDSWFEVQTTNSNPTNGVVYFQDEATNQNHRFYRAVMLPP